MRFNSFFAEYERTTLNRFLKTSPVRNKEERFSKNDVLSVSGELGVVNQIEHLGRSYAGESVALYHILRKGQIVYTKSPLAESPYGIIKLNRFEDGIVSTLYAVYDVLNKADCRYIEHYFAYKPRLNNYLRPIVRIGAKHDMKIGNDEVLNNYVIFPSKEEQKKISDFLDLIDQRIETQNKIIEKYESLMNLINNSFFKNVKTKIQFKDAYLRAGEGGTPDTKNSSYYFNGNVPFIKIDDLNKKFIKKSKTFITEFGLKHSSAWIVPPNSVLLSNGATIGETSINLISVATKQGILGIVPNAKYESEFLYYIFKSSYFKKQLKRITTKGTMDAAYLKDINKMKIPYLEIEMQKHHNKIMDCFENKIDSEKKLLQLYSKTKVYLLNNLFI